MITQSTVFNTNGTIFEVLEPRLLLDAAPDYLIIAGHAFFDGQGNVCAPIQQLADWKQMKGFPKQVVDVSSFRPPPAEVSAEDVKNYITYGSIDPYNPVWDAPPQYVLLVGDADQVPAATGSSTDYNKPRHITDAPYADMEDNPYVGHLPDLAIGRIPLSTVDDVTLAINKILTYDRTPDVPGPQGTLPIFRCRQATPPNRGHGRRSHGLFLPGCERLWLKPRRWGVCQ